MFLRKVILSVFTQSHLRIIRHPAVCWKKRAFNTRGHLRNNAVKNGKVIDMKMYSLLKEEGGFFMKFHGTDGRDKDFQEGTDG